VTEKYQKLTPTELKIAKLRVLGLAYKEIAHDLNIVPKTVQFHIRQIHTKLNVDSFGKLIWRMTELGLSPYNFKEEVKWNELRERILL
jgi:DNA-binding NarL/FixJ family response regulator